MNAAYVRQCLDYDSDTGLLRWKFRPREHFKCEHGFVSWTNKLAGKLAGYRDSRGYLKVAFGLKSYGAHRLAWLLVHGAWPKEIDHINGRPDDNRLANLREVSRGVNCQNRQIRSDNKSGVLGVYWDKKAGKWRAAIKVDGRRFGLGSFTSLEEAAAARASASKRYGFHENHGRAAT